jgi:hypothetical protein
MTLSIVEGSFFEFSAHAPMLFGDIFEDDPGVIVRDLAVPADYFGEFFSQRLFYFLRSGKHPDVNEWHNPSCRYLPIQKVEKI